MTVSVRGIFREHVQDLKRQIMRGLQGVYQESTWFSVALQIVAADLKRRIISSPKDEIAVILYGTASGV